MGPLQVLTVEQVMTVQGWQSGTTIVVDATGEGSLSVVVQARLVHVRRELRAAGGDLVLAVDPSTAAWLRNSGLHRTLAHWGDVPTAIAALEAASVGGGA